MIAHNNILKEDISFLKANMKIAYTQGLLYIIKINYNHMDLVFILILKIIFEQKITINVIFIIFFIFLGKLDKGTEIYVGNFN